MAPVDEKVGTNFKTFIAITVGFILILSLAWIWMGAWYNALLIQAIQLWIPASVILGQQGHNIVLSVSVDQGERLATVGVEYNIAMAYGLIVATSVLLAQSNFLLIKSLE